MEIVVRDYNESDLLSVNRLLFDSFSLEKGNFMDDVFREIVVCVDGDVAGYLLLTKVLNPIMNKYYYLVDYVCVAQEYRRLGLGEKLIMHASDIAKSHGAMYLQLTCSRFRIAAHKLYEKCGFIMRDSQIFRKEFL